MDKEECRFCGNVTSSENIKIKLEDDIKGFVNFKQFAEYFCRIDLPNDKKMPQGCCKVCYNTILGFCMFTVNVEAQQNKFKNRYRPEEPNQDEQNLSNNNSKDSNLSSNSGTKRKRPAKIGLAEIPKEDDAETRLRSKRLKTNEKINMAINEIKYNDKREKSEMTLVEALLEVNEVFKDKIQENEIRFEKITIKESLLNKETGEVPQDWLRKYNGFITWQDMTYECVTHCKKTIKSLRGLLDHFDENKVAQHKRAIKCNHEVSHNVKCGKVYGDQATNLVLYLNHMSRAHNIGHLKFTCILCEKVFVNVVKLTQHMIATHPERKLRLFQCFDCGLWFGHIEKLRSHKESHRYTDTESS